MLKDSLAGKDPAKLHVKILLLVPASKQTVRGRGKHQPLGLLAIRFVLAAAI